MSSRAEDTFPGANSGC